MFLIPQINQFLLDMKYIVSSFDQLSQNQLITVKLKE